MTADDHPEGPYDAAAGPLGIVCGGGAMPFAVADSAARRARSVFLLAIKGWADAPSVGRYPHAWIALGQFGRLCRLARDAGVRDIVCVGTLVRPALSAIRLDWATLRLMPSLFGLYRGGDDRLLSGIAAIFERHGFRLLGAHEVAPEILIAEGPLGRYRPAQRDLDDAAVGFSAIDALGPFDIGQAVVIADRRVLAVEAAEGTDAMLARIGELRRAKRINIDRGIGVLVKAAKPTQDRRMDLPAIGPATVSAVANAGLAGILARAGDVIVAEPQALIAAADKAGVFVAGVRTPVSVAP
jgi:UDP-2,3-diacylglucosamine hydrolase